jgi:hypothetical protein
MGKGKEKKQVMKKGERTWYDSIRNNSEKEHNKICTEKDKIVRKEDKSAPKEINQ